MESSFIQTNLTTVTTQMEVTEQSRRTVVCSAKKKALGTTRSKNARLTKRMTRLKTLRSSLR